MAVMTTTNTTDSATGKARRLTKLATRTPVEIDTVAAELDGEYGALISRRNVVLSDVHSAAGDTYHYVGKRKAWDMTGADALATLADKLATGTVNIAYANHAASTYANYGELTEAIAANRKQANRLDAEYQRRRWSRFIVVKHIHSGYDCVGGTLDRGHYRSDRQWLPEFSGMDEAEAIAKLAHHAHTLCTHCFPNAPVPERDAPVDPTVCTNKTYDPAKRKRMGYAYGNFATCSACGAEAPVSQIGNLRKHKRPTDDAGDDAD